MSAHYVAADYLKCCWRIWQGFYFIRLYFVLPPRRTSLPLCAVGLSVKKTALTLNSPVNTSGTNVEHSVLSSHQRFISALPSCRLFPAIKISLWTRALSRWKHKAQVHTKKKMGDQKKVFGTSGAWNYLPWLKKKEEEKIKVTVLHFLPLPLRFKRVSAQEFTRAAWIR